MYRLPPKPKPSAVYRPHAGKDGAILFHQRGGIQSSRNQAKRLLRRMNPADQSFAEVVSAENASQLSVILAPGDVRELIGKITRVERYIARERKMPEAVVGGPRKCAVWAMPDGSGQWHRMCALRDDDPGVIADLRRFMHEEHELLKSLPDERKGIFAANPHVPLAAEVMRDQELPADFMAMLVRDGGFMLIA
ncbi:MAG: hypothetical protein AAB650_00300 [Patescibacteria group bacterium]